MELQERTHFPSSSDYPSHHGLLAPGVKLFRAWRFGAKAICILTVLLVPMLILTVQLYRTESELLETTRQELLGLRYMRAASALANDLNPLRRAASLQAPDLNEKKAKALESFTKLQQAHKALSADLGDGTRDAFNTAVKALEAALQTPVRSSPDETFELHSANVTLLHKLMGTVADESQLSLDPELDTYHMGVIVSGVGPQYEEYLGRVRGLGALVLAHAAAEAVPGQRRRSIEKTLSVVDYIDPIYENSYKKSIEAFAEVAKTMDMKGVDSSREAFMALVGKQVLVDDPRGDVNDFLALGKKAVDLQTELNNQIAVRLESQLQARINRVSTTVYTQLALVAVSVVVSLYLFLCFYVVMRGGLRLVSRHLHELASGDLRNRPANPWGKDEPAELILDLQVLYEALHTLIRSVRHGARELANTSSEVSRASNDLAVRTDEAAASLGQQAVAVDEIGNQVSGTAYIAEQAAGVARQNAEVADRGGRIIADVVSTMREIQQSSSRIADIIGTIDGIAFQTNILALNAAVEAARAGESGRGFAVVATEVRSLAGRSAEAAREIKNLISASVAKVEAGTEVVEGAGKAMTEMDANAGQINTLLGTVSEATNAQASGVREVVEAIRKLDAHTQQNAALVEETSASAGSLSDQATHLTGEIARFVVA